MIQAAWMVTMELAPWLLLGTFIAAFLHVALPPGFIRRRLRGPAAVFQAVGLGVPLPLCSCGVIPAGIGLKKQGASDGAAIGFLISTPQTGVDSILMSAGFFGWPFAIFKVFGAALTGIIGGLVTEAVSHEPPPVQPASGESAEAPRGAREFWNHGIEILRSIWIWLVIGVLVSAAIEVLMPAAWIGEIDETGGILLSSLAALLVSLPLYVCAVASVPIAGALVAKGLPAGAALVFLMAGPATNVATIGAIYRTFGRRVFAIYLATIVIGSFGLALLFDAVAQPLVVVGEGGHRHGDWWHVASAVALLICFAGFAYQDASRWMRRRTGGGPASDRLHVDVAGMTCDGCASRLESALRSTPGVDAAEVTFKSGEAIVWGSIEEPRLLEQISAAGFRGEKVTRETAGER